MVAHFLEPQLIFFSQLCLRMLRLKNIKVIGYAFLFSFLNIDGIYELLRFFSQDTTNRIEGFKKQQNTFISAFFLVNSSGP